jgi:hypothetical protein
VGVPVVPCLVAGKKVGVPNQPSPETPAILATIDHDVARWATRVTAFGSGWHRAAGSAQDLVAMAERMGQQWLKGIRLALKLG